MKKAVIIIAIMIFLTGASGCSLERKKPDVEKTAIDYTVVEDADVPEEFMEVIQGKKSEPFKITFSDKENLFIAIGYGEQPTGGYSITVEEIYQTGNTVEIKTQFAGPVKNEQVAGNITYPYIVIKVEDTDKTVKFL